MEKHCSPGFVEAHEKQLQITAPLITLPGSNEYHDKLDIGLHEVLPGRLTPEEAMKKAAEAGEEITEGEGRERQIKAWAAPGPPRRLWSDPQVTPARGALT